MSDVIVPTIKDFSKANNPYVREMNGGFVFYNLKKILRPADEHKFGVVAINCRHEVIVEAALTAAFEAKSPIILEIAESEQKYCNMSPKKLADIVVNKVNEKIDKYGYSVPVALHMDHVQKDMSLIDQAIEAGFSSVEADLSKLPLEQNIERSKEIVAKLHPFGISVELEEGEIGAVEALADPNIDSNIESYYTKAEDAIKLAEECRPEALAIFVGNGHGKYLKEPRIGFDRIGEVAEGVKGFGTCVVLHGGSGLSNEVFNKAIEAGARKINYATSVSDIFFENLPAELIFEMDEKAKELNTARRKVLYLFEDKIATLPAEVLNTAVLKMAEHIMEVMEHGFLSAGKAELY